MILGGGAVVQIEGRQSKILGLLPEAAALAQGNDGKARLYLVSGRVQGVGYRYFVMRTAQRLGIRGTVKNLRDGRVEVAAAGTAESMAAFYAELEHGPDGAQVKSIDEGELPSEHEFGDEFKVEYER
jgi:acylphosphatase